MHWFSIGYFLDTELICWGRDFTSYSIRIFSLVLVCSSATKVDTIFNQKRGKIIEFFKKFTTLYIQHIFAFLTLNSGTKRDALLHAIYTF